MCRPRDLEEEEEKRMQGKAQIEAVISMMSDVLVVELCDL